MRLDLALLFTLLTALSGVIWLVDALFFGRARRKVMAEEQAAVDQVLLARAERIRAIASGISGTEIGRATDAIEIRTPRSEDAVRLRGQIETELPDLEVKAAGDGLEARLRDPGPRRHEPMLVEYSRAFFPVILIILLVRSFLAEPYRIPSESMMPNLLIGDFILVNKYSYGLRLPVLDTKVVKVGEPQRGDVIVFHPPTAPDQVWIKRVIGVPGDVIDYHNYQLTINGQPVEVEPVGPYLGQGSGSDMTGAQVVREKLPERTHTVLQLNLPGPMQPEAANGTWTVPAGHYFMMGDNRDNSEDSRFWPSHFLPEENVVGKAELVWMNLDFGAWRMDSSRIGTIIR